jgi:hypothetical protein
MTDSTSPRPRPHVHGKPWGKVYFIQAGAFVKIGWSKDPERRLAQLATACPHELTLLGEITGTVLDEQALHRAFAHLRARGEWFHAEPWLVGHLRWLACFDEDWDFSTMAMRSEATARFGAAVARLARAMSTGDSRVYDAIVAYGESE